jgi:hypothetical protein
LCPLQQRRALHNPLLLRRYDAVLQHSRHYIGL